MGHIPTFLLRKQVTIEPYLGVWGAYGPAGLPVRCMYDERLVTSVQQAGVVRAATITIVVQLLDAPPEGSRILLDGGRVGYASAVARHDSGGLPRVPDHAEIAVSLPAPSYGSPLGSETVTILRRVLQPGGDRYGNERYTTSEVDVPGAVVRITGNGETPGEGGSSLSTTLEVILPPGTAVTANDRLRIRGLTYEVDGDPEVRTDPMLGGNAGVQVVARHVTG